MSMPRFTIAFAAASLLTAIIVAQEVQLDLRQPHFSREQLVVLHDQEGARAAKLTLWAIYAGTDGEYQDQAQYLADLQARFRDQSIVVTVVLPKAHAAEVASSKPRFVVARCNPPWNLTSIPGMHMVISTAGDGHALAASRSLDLAVDTMQLCLKSEFDRDQYYENQATLAALSASVGDGGDLDAEVAQCLTRWPHSGLAHACAVLNQWWCKGDLAGARKAIDAGLQALGNEAVPMTFFVDMVLRGDRFDPDLARKLAMAMAPVAAGAPQGPVTQLVYLRALLRTGQDRLAGRIAAQLPKHLGDRANLQLVFAETLMEGNTPAVFRDQAERAIQSGEANGAERKWVYAARHKVLTRCLETTKATQLLDEYRARHLSSGLNNDAWYLMVQPESMGRYDSLALALCEEMQGADQVLDYGSMDTMALALFLNGHFDKAIEMQSDASKQADNRATYVARLRRYQESQAERAARTEKAGK